MKNVLLLGSELGKGGAERSISLLSYYLEQEGYNVTLCILSGTDREQFYKTCKNVVFIDPPAYSGIVGKIKAWRYRLHKLKQLKKDLKIDTSISFLEGPDYVNILTKGKEKVVLSIRGSKMHDKVISGIAGSIRKKVLIPQLYRKANEIVCVTNALADEMHEHFGIKKSRLTTVYNFYEIGEILSKSEEELTSDEKTIFSKPVIITSGRLHVGKEFDKMIRILHEVKKQYDCRLMILGDGEMKDQLTNLATQINLTWCDWRTQKMEDADIYFMGFQHNAFKFYKHSRLFAMTSSWEGFPNVLAEALICGVPVVSTDCPTGPREILNLPDLPKEPIDYSIDTPVGTLLPMVNHLSEKSLKLWTEAIVKWLQQTAPSKNEFEMLTKRFTLQSMLQQWKNVIDN